MSKKKKKSTKRRSGGGSFGGGGRWGVNMQQTAMGAACSWVGTQIKAMLPTGTPAIIAAAPIGDLGLYGLGVLFRDRAARSFAVGRVVGSTITIGG